MNQVKEPVFRWEDPPAKLSEQAAAILRELKGQPGRWALVNIVRSSSEASKWRKLGCEARHERQEDGSYKVWARWPETKVSGVPTAPAIPAKPAGTLVHPGDVEVKVNGVPSGRFVPQGTPLRPKGGPYTQEARLARGVPPEGNPL